MRETIEMNRKYLIIKRVMDILTAFVLLLVLSPVIILSFLIQWIDIGTWPIFIQKRPGKNEIPFNIIKLKTMNERKGVNGELLPDNMRITLLGRFFRSTSIDELPQLVNVLKGDMSFVGPRPLLMTYLDLYDDEQKKRHNVRPGITGLAQVNGRNSINWEDKFVFDLQYVNHCSFSMDFKILVRTVQKVLAQNDIQNDVNQTMPTFTGSRHRKSYSEKRTTE